MVPSALSARYQPSIPVHELPPETFIVTDDGLVLLDESSPAQRPQSSSREVSVSLKDLVIQISASWASWEAELMAVGTKPVTLPGSSVEMLQE